MAAVLGVSANYHDAAAALVVDGRIVAAMQEERFSRIKNDASLPLHAIDACLREDGLDAGALDAVVFYENPYEKLERVLLGALRTFPRSLRAFPRAMASQLGGKLWVLDALASRLGVARGKVHHAEHHASHAASAFFVSPFERAAILTVDGVGEDVSSAIWRGDGKRIEPIERIAYPHSLGLMYAALTAYLGFRVNEGESKVMGLAAFGAPRLRDEFARLLQLQTDGTFTLGLAYFDEHTDTEIGFGPKLEALLGPRRAPERAWDLDGSADDRRYADVAATLQAVTEDALCALAARARKLAGCDALCMAGGVALNAVANARIARGGPLFVQPAAGDAGGALGAALQFALAAGDPRPPALAHAALGQRIDPSEAHALAGALGLRVQRVGDAPACAAERLARGEIVGFVQGRFEWGPRALGRRSLLALPGPAKVRERLNRAIKRREPFRPFAPAVLAEHAPRFFGEHDARLTPFMTTVADVLPEQRGALAAVTHVDGSARLQTVSAEHDPAFAALLAAVGQRTDVPVVLNTSLNGKDQPIAAGAADALHFLLTHRIDAMLIEDVLIETGAARAEALP
jgi:carbamoyltransferase